MIIPLSSDVFAYGFIFNYNKYLLPSIVYSFTLTHI